MSETAPKTEEEIRESYEYRNFRFDDEGAFAGGGIVESYSELVRAAKQEGENDKAQIGVASVAVGLDTLGLVLDPLGTVLAAGIGWLIEHIGFLREPLDILMGDPDEVKANAALLHMEAAKIAGYAEEHKTALEAVKTWTGEAADKFDKSMRDLYEEVVSLGLIVAGKGDMTIHFGVVVAALRALVRDIIAILVGTLLAGAIAALAASWITFGASIAGFIAFAIGAAATVMAKITATISKVIGLVGKANKQMADMAKWMAELAKRMDRYGNAAKKNTHKPGGNWHEFGPPYKDINDVQFPGPKPPAGGTKPPPAGAGAPVAKPPPPARSNSEGAVPAPGSAPVGPPRPGSGTAPAGAPPKLEPPPRASSLPPNSTPHQDVPKISWDAWKKGGYKNHEQLMRPINALNRLPSHVVAETFRKLFGNKQGNVVMDAFDAAKNARDPFFTIRVGGPDGVPIPVGAFGAAFSQAANEATKADDGREKAREDSGNT